MQVQISAGRALNEMAVYTVGPGLVGKCAGQCTVWGSVCWGCKIFLICF